MSDNEELDPGMRLTASGTNALVLRSGGLAKRGLELLGAETLLLAAIEALALAIDGRDQTSPSHIRRVQVYAAGLAKSLGMADNEIQGLKIAALLHDIGKLAVPEHILSKSGPLTLEEFQKLRIHPQVGAEIISGVPFPYPVAPLILSHHERWDGKGYPSGQRLTGVATTAGAIPAGQAGLKSCATTAGVNDISAVG